MKFQTTDIRAITSLVLASACWGTGTLLTKNILGAFPPISLLVVQLTVSVAVLWALVLAKSIRLPHKPQIFKLGLLGLLNPGISYTLSLIGLTNITASISALLWAAEPVLILLLAGLILREKLTLRLLALSFIAIFGVVLISGVVTGSVSTNQIYGYSLTLAGVLCCALYTVLARRAGSQVDTLLVIALQQSFALVWALAIWPVELGFNGLGQILQLSLGDWVWAGISGLFYYALAFWFYLQGLNRVNASTAGVFLNLIPIFAMSGAYLFLGERLSLSQWTGAGIILIAVLGIFLWEKPAQVNLASSGAE
jgi:drug/metabolite transporter (DMT)-like permease